LSLNLFKQAVEKPSRLEPLCHIVSEPKLHQIKTKLFPQNTLSLQFIPFSPSHWHPWSLS